MINMLKKGNSILYTLRVYFPQSYFESKRSTANVVIALVNSNRITLEHYTRYGLIHWRSIMYVYYTVGPLLSAELDYPRFLWPKFSTPKYCV